MTKKEMFVAIANVPAVAENAEMVDFLNHQIELLENRKSSPRKGMTKTQKENITIKEAIMSALAETENFLTVTELISLNNLNNYTNQKISALLRQLVSEGKVTKRVEGKKSYFGIAED